MQLNLEFAIKFWVLQFSGLCLQKEGKRLSIPEPIHYHLFFFLKPICKKMQSNPESIDHLGLPMPIHFLKINPTVLQWLGALQSSNSLTFAWENLSEKVFGWRFLMEKMTDQTFFWKNTCFFKKRFLNKTNVFLNKHVFLTKNPDCLNKSKIFLNKSKIVWRCSRKWGVSLM